MNNIDNMIGFYLFENMACQVRKDNNEILIAEYYRPGAGFQEMLLSDLIWHGEPISESEFKNKIITKQ